MHLDLGELPDFLDIEADGKPISPPSPPGESPSQAKPESKNQEKQESPVNLAGAVQELAKLSSLEYDRIRREAAKKLGVRPGTLDSEVRRCRKGEVDNDLPFDEVEPWEEPIDPAALLTEISQTVRRFIICNQEVANAVALWVALTWLSDVVNVAPLAVITAPEKRCGKSQLLFILGRLSARSIMASSISPAALYRSIDAWAPTLLIDEADAFLKDNEELRGLINSGHTRDSAYVIRTVGDDHTPKKFNTWGFKAIAGIGKLADTLMDRSIILELRRKTATESVERIRHAEPDLFKNLQSKLARFAEDYAEEVRMARPPLPEKLNDRAQDNWEPLLAIAKVAGPEWLEIGTKAAKKISGEESASQTVGTELLADIRETFDHKRIDRISTADLIRALCEDDEKAWATYNRGFPIKPRQLAQKLKQYSVTSKTIRVGAETPKGYEREQFEDAFFRYIATPPENIRHTPQTSIHAGLRVADDTTRCGSETQKATENPSKISDVALLRINPPQGGQKEKIVALTEADFEGGLF